MYNKFCGFLSKGLMMGSLGNPKPWGSIPHMNPKDCSEGFCSLYCPQWCYIIFPPPPPPFGFPDDNSGPNLSPLVIAIIGILVSAFLLISYYTIISKYCGNVDSERRESHEANEEVEESENPMQHEPWHVVTAGLDEALIESITVCKYKKGDGLVEGNDCSVCLGEFQEDESLRLLPKCSHAFHVPCIDTWLKSHSNCPLCRANIVSVSAAPLQSSAPVTETRLSNESSPETRDGNEGLATIENTERGVGELVQIMRQHVVPKTPLRVFSDLGNSEQMDTIIEIRDGKQHIGRSVSMDFSIQNQISVADILRMNEEEQEEFPDVGSSKQAGGELNKHSQRYRVLHCVMSPVAMKRSFSSGRFSLSRNGRGRNEVIPL